MVDWLFLIHSIRMLISNCMCHVTIIDIFKNNTKNFSPCSYSFDYVFGEKVILFHFLSCSRIFLIPFRLHFSVWGNRKKFKRSMCFQSFHGLLKFGPNWGI